MVTLWKVKIDKTSTQNLNLSDISQETAETTLLELFDDTRTSYTVRWERTVECKPIRNGLLGFRMKLANILAALSQPMQK